jgi:hypothetical protein
MHACGCSHLHACTQAAASKYGPALDGRAVQACVEEAAALVGGCMDGVWRGVKGWRGAWRRRGAGGWLRSAAALTDRCHGWPGRRPPLVDGRHARGPNRPPNRCTAVPPYPPQVTDADLSLAAGALRLLVTLLRVRPADAGGAAAERVLGAALALVRSPLLQGTALDALRQFFAALAGGWGRSEGSGWRVLGLKGLRLAGGVFGLAGGRVRV